MDSEHQHDFLLESEASDPNKGASISSIRGLVFGCPDCAALATDIESIRLALMILPAPGRSRDFRLDATTAARLRRRRFALPDWLAWPLAPGLVAAGLALLLLSPGAALPAAVAPIFDAPLALSPNQIAYQANTSASWAEASGFSAASAPPASGAPIFGSAGVILAPSAGPSVLTSPVPLRSSVSSPVAVTAEPMVGSNQLSGVQSNQGASPKLSDSGPSWQFELQLAGLILIGFGLVLLFRHRGLRSS